MKMRYVAAISTICLMLAVPTATAASAATQGDSVDGRLDCTGTPTNIGPVDNLYQNTCDILKGFCELFDPCPIT